MQRKPHIVEGPGTELKRILSSLGISPSPSCHCGKKMAEMNRRGVEGCRATKDEIAGWLREGQDKWGWASKVKAAALAVTTGIAFKVNWADPFPDLVEEACKRAEGKPTGQARLLLAAEQVSATSPPKPWGAPIKWAVGLTTVPQRRHTILPRTLDSLARAGFEGQHAPRLFVDGDPGPWPEFPNPATFRWPSMRVALPDGNLAPCPWSNWWLGIQELYLRCPDADRYVMFQDDLVAVRNLRQYLEASPFPEGSYLNLFSFQNNEALMRGEPGWIEAAPLPPPSSLGTDSEARTAWMARRLQCGRGALALVFDRKGLVELLRFKDTVERALEHPAGRGLTRIDGGVVDSMNKLGRREWVHRPSLVQHMGTESTASRVKDPKTEETRPKTWRENLARSFPGEEFDVMELLSANEGTKQSVSQG